MPNPTTPDQEDQPADKNLRKRSVAGAKSYAKYSGLAIQMVVILLVFVYGGKWLDAYFESPKPYYTTGLALIGITLALYVPLRGLLKE
ncbi:MAG: AtpZ/AtpI family protein [Saprospiraceae bacterium]